MITKIVTSKSTENKTVELQNMLGLSTKAAVLRIALAYSLKSGAKLKKDFCLSSDGAAYSTQTVFSDKLQIVENMILVHEERELSDHEINLCVNYYIENGIDKLFAKNALLHNKEKFIKYLLEARF